MSFDPNLNFQYHFKKISTKLYKALYILRSSKNLLTKKSPKAINYSIFHCYLIYCVPIIWSCASQKLINGLCGLQIRLINGSKFNAHTEHLFKELCILPPEKIIEFFYLQFMQQFIQGLLPKSFSNEDSRPENSHHILRNSQCCGAGPILTGSGSGSSSGYRLRLRLSAPAPDNNIFVTQIK